LEVTKNVVAKSGDRQPGVTTDLLPSTQASPTLKA
jgi:hypothetical protein